MTFKDIPSCLKGIEERYKNNEKLRRKLAKHTEPIQVTFLDTERQILILVNGDQGIEVKDNAGDDTAPIKIDFVSEKTLIDMFNKELGAVKAYSSGKVKVIEGKIRNLIKLKSLLF
jgi:putative sterol carrier protein